MFAMLFVCNMIARGVQAMPDHSVLDTPREVPPDGIRLTFGDDRAKPLLAIGAQSSTIPSDSPLKS